MKFIKKIKVLTFLTLVLLSVTGCEEENIVDFGNDGAISGTLKDPNNNIVAGSITSANLAVKALGDGDQVTTDIRVKGDGTFQNTKLYPKSYKIWVTGPIMMTTDTFFIDFSKEKVVKHDLVVIPFISIGNPVVSGSPTASAMNVNYAVAGNEGKTVSKRELYCSTNPYPDASTGSGPFYETIKVTLDTNEGTAAVTGLTPDTKYYIRIGAQATGASGFNYSDQIEVTTPSN